MRQSETTLFRWMVLLLVMSGVFLSTMDSGMVSVALPTIMRSFNLSLEYSELVITIYLFTITVTLVLWGKLGDLFGRFSIYLSGMSIFALGAFSCYLSSSFTLLLLSRVLQGLGASMMMSSGPAIIKTVFPSDHLGRGLGLVGIATACGLLTGPFVSGQLLTVFTWKTIFLVTLPINLIAVVSGVILCKNYLSRTDLGGDVIEFDWSGFFCWFLLVLLWLIIFHRLSFFFSPVNCLTLVAFACVFYLFVRIEQTALFPIIPLFLFKDRNYWVGVVTAAVSFATLFSVLVLIPFCLEYIFKAPVEKVGLVMMALPATIVIFAPFSGWLYDKVGAKYLTSFGLFLCGVGILSLAWISKEISIATVMVKLSVIGAGQSIFLSPNSASVLANVSDKFAGSSAGILATARNFGMVTGATLSAAVFSFFYRYMNNGKLLADFDAADVSVFLSAWQYTFILIAAVSFLASIVSLRRS